MSNAMEMQVTPYGHSRRVCFTDGTVTFLRPHERMQWECYYTDHECRGYWRGVQRFMRMATADEARRLDAVVEQELARRRLRGRAS